MTSDPDYSAAINLAAYAPKVSTWISEARGQEQERQIVELTLRSARKVVAHGWAEGEPSNAVAAKEIQASPELQEAFRKYIGAYAWKFRQIVGAPYEPTEEPEITTTEKLVAAGFAVVVIVMAALHWGWL